MIFTEIVQNLNTVPIFSDMVSINDFTTNSCDFIMYWEKNAVLLCKINRRSRCMTLIT